MECDLPLNFESNRRNLLESTTFDEKLINNSKNGNVLPNVLESFGKPRPQLFALMMALFAASQAIFPPEKGVETNNENPSCADTTNFSQDNDDTSNLDNSQTEEILNEHCAMEGSISPDPFPGRHEFLDQAQILMFSYRWQKISKQAKPRW